MLALDLITLLLITFPNTANYTTPVPSARHRRMVGVRVSICFALNPFVTTRRTYNLNKHTHTVSEPKGPPATIAGSALEVPSVGPFWASALRRSARKSVRRVDRPSGACLYRMPGVRDTAPASASTHSTVKQPTRTRRSGSTTHIGRSHTMGAAARQRQSKTRANTNAAERAPIRRPTRIR